MKKIELLAPAGDFESLYAAMQNGADAVYLGGSKFSARAYASNFHDENMIKAVEYVHAYGGRIFVTLNILIKENEIEEALAFVKFLYEIGVDALIIQDTGLIYLIKKEFPDFELHGSTQMTVHNGEGALLLKDLGLKRIVLSRELSLKEVKHISTDLGVETEVFIHGALCICYSGQCLMSSLIGGRSGNRGKCAQPCRLPYTLINKKEGTSRSAFILSPKDTCSLENIKDIIETGTSSLKIEGRMKRPEYVAGVVQIYRKAIDSVYSGKEFDLQAEIKKLMKLFNREGFSKAYMLGNPGKSLMAYNYGKNTGISIGSAENDLSILLKEDISIKDGVRIDEGGFIIQKIIKAGTEVPEAFIGDRVKLIPSNYKQGNILYKTSDVKLLDELSDTYRSPYGSKTELSLEVTFKVGEGIVLRTKYDDQYFTVVGEKVQTALKKPLDKERISESLGKAGDTVFKFSNIIFLEYEEGFLPVSAVNSSRRELVNALENYIKDKHKRDRKVSLKPLNYYKSEKEKIDTKGLPEVLVCVNNEEAFKAAIDSGIENIAVNIFNRGNSMNLDNIKIPKLYLKIPNIIKEEFESICNIIEEKLPSIEGILTGNLGIINRFKGRTKIIGDYKLNVFNSFSLNFYENFLQGAYLSLELNKKEIGEILNRNKDSYGILIYGRAELMVSEYCPIGSMIGGRDQEIPCNKACEKGDYILKDRKDAEFIVATDKFCRSYIYNNAATNLIGNQDEMKKMNLTCFRLDFIDENYDEVVEVIKNFKQGKWSGDFSKFTRGHFKRGVE